MHTNTHYTQLCYTFNRLKVIGNKVVNTLVVQRTMIWFNLSEEQAKVHDTVKDKFDSLR